jgi:hypothetical protein
MFMAAICGLDKMAPAPDFETGQAVHFAAHIVVLVHKW